MEACKKFFLFLMVLLFCLFGWCFFYLGYHARYVHGDELSMLTDEYLAVPLLFILGGIVSVIISFIIIVEIGVSKCLGHSCFNTCVLVTFFLLGSLIVLAELSGSVAMLILRSKVRENLAFKMDSHIHSTYTNLTDMDSIQQTYHCCGVHNYSDWFDTVLGQMVNVPDSCCIEQSPGCGARIRFQPEIDQIIYIDGCLDYVASDLKHLIGIGAMIAIGASIIHLIGLIVAGKVASSLRRGYEPLY